jgi:dynein heavy chain 1
MFRVFQIFNALFTRPRIRGAIQEYQIQLLIKVEKDIEVLRDKLLNNQDQEQHQSTMLNRVRGFPDLSNKIIWTKQIERRLATYMKRVEDVLGSNWKDLHQGKKLKQIGDNFQQALQARQDHYLTTWQSEIQRINAANEKAKNVFNIEQRIDRYHFYLDFDMQLLHLPQELNQLKIMDDRRLPLSIHLKAQDVQNLYPIAMSLQESLRTFEYTESRVVPKFAKLVAESRLQAQQLMMRGLQSQWRSDTYVEKYAKELRRRVTEFEEAVNDVIEEIALIDEYLEELQTCELDQELLAERIEKVQKIIDRFEIEGYSNLQIWVDELDKRISDILVDRLGKRLQQWMRDFSAHNEDNDAASSLVDTSTLRIKMQNQTFILDPPLAEARAYWYTQLHGQVEVICGLKRVEAQRYGKINKQDSQREKTYTSLVK